MPAKTYPNLGLKGGYNSGEGGWGADMSANLLKLSILTQGGVLDRVADYPGSPTDGDIYINTTSGKVAARVEGAWVEYTPLEGWLLYDRAADAFVAFQAGAWAPLDTGGGAEQGLESLILAVSDETTAVAAGVGKLTFRMPYAFVLTGVRSSLTVAGSTLSTVDLNQNGVSILSTKLTIDGNEKTSTTAATPAVISQASLSDDAEITVDIDNIGAGAVGLKVTLIGYRV